ncbi:DUF4232 domain-containing protein [Streptomyces sp. Je 1-79]|uniref:DUF4232 domain-containing protein n=1 Tax=Streptomyces sp. Je 1-79 TaxID=2943847 RepID=UPI0021A4F5D0|nr:DUF4232 domain-containing protein [Streptomyces sp. Je 1-79]MCT4356240.1 DUF4232 domain-containing protein [Streptomyces sp. Je 1-79]
MRSYRTRTTVLAAVTAALALGLTACGGEAGPAAQGPKAAASTSTSAPQKGTEAGAAGTEAGTAGGAGASAGAGTGGSGIPAARTGSQKKPGGAAPACTVHDVKVSAAAQEGVPTTHITLTATNVSGRACTLLRYPLIAFGDIQTAEDVPSVAKSRPATPVVLAPGAPAYAAVRINDGSVDEENRAVTSFHVNLFAADGPAEGSEVVTAPAGGIAVDDAAARTGFWTPELRNGADEF